MNWPIYLDYAAATPVGETVLAAMQPYFSSQFYNPSALYLVAKDVSAKLEDARAGVAHWLGARPAEIVFTAGATEANNLAIHGVMRQYPEGNMVVNSVEHEAVLAPAHEYDCREVAVTPDGSIDLKALERTIDGHTVLVSVMYANNEVGTIQPLREVAQIIQKKRAERTNNLPLLFHTDAAQAGNYLDLHAARLGVDLMSINGGKIYGPKQSGALFVKAGVTLKPLIMGGGQESGLRSGTENVAGAVGLAAALELVQVSRREETERLQKLQKLFIELLEKQIVGAVLNGSRTHRLPNNVHITVPGQDNERLLMQLDEAGILAAAGSACSASDEEPSHVLRAMGLSDQDAQASLRFTMGRSTTENDIRHTVDVLATLL
ncbi:MAG TPA: cysteine desulfurase family protein [Candidatus Saccharimonadales bacterium]|nr:cysteine desulfurase family protein [Candidatus Saccharimonadales bacterium]